jgi:hypothetical protein
MERVKKGIVNIYKVWVLDGYMLIVFQGLEHHYLLIFLFLFLYDTFFESKLICT